MTELSVVEVLLPRDGRSAKQRTSDRTRAAKQMAQVAERWNDRELWRERVNLVIDDRRERPHLPPREDGIVRVYDRLERFDNHADDPILVVAGEYLVRVDDLSDLQRRELIEKRRARPVEHLETRVFRVTVPRRSGAAKVRLRSEAGDPLDARSTSGGDRAGRVKEHFATPMGPVMKASCGPEPSGGLQAQPSTVAPRSGLQVAVVDTGIANVPRTDGWLVNVPISEDNTDLLDDLPPDCRLDLGAGHGTFAAGVVQQLAPDARIRAYRALDGDGFGTEAMVATAMVQAAKDGATIINLSLGLETDDDAPPVGLQAAVELIRERWPEVVIVAAAGNYGANRPCWPAAFKGVTAVAGLDRKLKPAVWSSYGSWVDCSTIGEAVLSTFVPGTERDDVDPDVVPDSYPRDAWAIWTGTSFAAPQVTGAVAQIAQRESISPRDALARLLQGRPELSNFGRVVPILPPT